jgi:flagellar protein FliS
MHDMVSLYRTAQAVTSNPVERVVLLYEGAVRFAVRHLDALERGDEEAAHHASVRCQEIAAELQEVLDLEAGPIAHQLDAVYRFILDRLVAGNLARNPAPTTEALELLRELLGAWQEVARRTRAGYPVMIGAPVNGGDPGHAAAAAGLAGFRPGLA